MNYVKLLTKGALGFITGLAAVIVLGVIQSISGYNPTVCSDTTPEGIACTPQIIVSAYQMVIPIVTAALVGLANWLKNRGK